jgi:enediyne biosynthesis protein E4
MSYRGHRFALGLCVLVLGATGCQDHRSGDSGTTGKTGSTDSGTVGDSAAVDRYAPAGQIHLSLLSLGPVKTCAEPAATVTYTDVGESSGLTAPIGPVNDNGGSGASLAVDDLDQDGDLDVVIGFPEERLGIFWNDGNAFVKGTTIEHTKDTRSLNLADMNGDGWVDILTGGGAFPGIVWNDRGTLEAHETLNMVGQMTRIRELSPADIDGDGDVDLYGLSVKTNAFPGDEWDMLLWNNGDSTFTVDTDTLGHDDATGQGFDAGWFDWDDDGDLDVYVANDQGTLYGPDFMLSNDGGALSNARDTCICGPTHTGMNMDAGDFDGDGLFDLIVTTATNNALLKQYPDRTFVDVTYLLNARSQSSHTDDPTGWGALFFDHENDGDADILVALGGYSDGRDKDADESKVNQTPSPLSLLAQDADGQFGEIGDDLGFFQDGTFRSLVTQDFNDDGVLDILATDYYTAPRLYMSNSCTAAGWLRIAGPPGSKVSVTIGERTWVDHITRESGYGAGQPANVHVGLGDEDTIDRLEVRLPDGRLLVREGPLAANRVVTVTEPGPLSF